MLFDKLIQRDDIKQIFNIVGDIADLYIVGGAVRDIIFFDTLKKNIDVDNILDIDFCVNMEVSEFYNALKQKVSSKVKISDNLKQYGVINLFLNGIKYDITMFRKDIYFKNSRYPDVRYTSDIFDDAMRRDFTFNALYLDKNSNIISPIDKSLQDAKNFCVRFVENVDTKINEDALRIVRYIRMIHKVYKLKFNKTFVDISKIELNNIDDIINFIDDYLNFVNNFNYILFDENDIIVVKNNLYLLRTISFNKLKQEILKFDK